MCDEARMDMCVYDSSLFASEERRLAEIDQQVAAIVLENVGNPRPIWVASATNNKRYIYLVPSGSKSAIFRLSPELLEREDNEQILENMRIEIKSQKPT